MMDLRTGTIVESKHHGKGKVLSVGSEVRILFEGMVIAPKEKEKAKGKGKGKEKEKKAIRWPGGEFLYGRDGRYFTDEKSAFCEKESALKIISQPEEGRIR